MHLHVLWPHLLVLVTGVLALAGLAVRALWHIEWADPLAALAITPLILREARQSWRGKSCSCC